MNKESLIYVAGHTGLVGSAVLRELQGRGYENILTRTHKQLELCNQLEVHNFFEEENPEYVFLCAAHAGGIKEAINNPSEMLLHNLLIQANVISESVLCAKKLLFLGSSCIYPVDAKQPYREEQIGTGKTDENWSYAIAKLTGIELCRAFHKQYGCNFLTAIPCNLYGINDNFSENGHVIPSLIRKISEGDTPEIWSGRDSRREFLYADDFAEAAVMLMERYDYEHLCDGVINVGSSHEYMIGDVANIIRDIVSPNAVFIVNSQTPAGVPSKVMDNSRITALGWKPKTFLIEGIKKVYASYRSHNQSI